MSKRAIVTYTDKGTIKARPVVKRTRPKRSGKNDPNPVVDTPGPTA